MAERIVSPGVFTRERDLSFLPQGIAEIGAAIIGPTVKGPAFTPSIVRNFQEFEEVFGGVDSRFYTPYTVQQYLRSAGTVTVIRVLGLGGYAADSVELKVTTNVVAGHLMGGNTVKTGSLAVLAPSRGSSGTGNLDTTTISGDWNAFTLTVSGSDITTFTAACSFNTSSAKYIDEVIPSDPLAQKSGTTTCPVYLYKNYKRAQSSGLYSAGGAYGSASITATNNGIALKTGTQTFDDKGSANTWTGNSSYSVARTPYIQSQLISGARYSLFRIYTRSHGSNVNFWYRAAILNVKAASAVAGSDYGTFSLQLRSHNPGNSPDRAEDGTVLEQWDGLTFDPNNPNYFARVIGDRFVEIDSSGKLTYKGQYPNLSKHIRVGDYLTGIDDQSYPKTVVPMGHNKVYNPIPGTTGVPTASFKIEQTNAVGDFDQNVFFGINFAHDDTLQYLAPIVATANNGANVTMSLEDMYGHADASTLGSTYASATHTVTLSGSAIQQRKFQLPFQWGFDGENPAVPKLTGTDITAANQQGFDHTNSNSSGSIAYKRAINAVSNPDEFDINLLVTPGVNHRLHSTTTNHAISKIEDRADAFYIMDSAAYGDSIATTINTIKTLDTNYAATYYPWVKVLDEAQNRPVWVPPSVVLPSVIAFTDKVAHEWFAPAGLNRGGLTQVLEAKTRLTHAERDDLYEDRINPIASFPGQGVCVWGQKTLQGKPSALDRVNVRRLLIALKKFIASSSRYLVFEQNTVATRNRFLNVVNPFLESVQQNSGLSSFRVVMDDTNNTPDVIDRNRLVGQIFLQPTRTAEFIVLDFVILPTGASFPE
jgi:hypothetical protein